jgi:hypothetical protein
LLLKHFDIVVAVVALVELLPEFAVEQALLKSQLGVSLDE